MIYRLNDEAATVALGAGIAAAIAKIFWSAKPAQEQSAAGLTLYLLGDLGAGKTTLSRGIINGLGHRGAVKSPTYTLVEPYEISYCQSLANSDGGGNNGNRSGDAEASTAKRPVYHFDLYRLADPAELEFLGLDDYFSALSLCLIEWPERGAGFIPAADIKLTLEDYRIATPEQSIGRELLCEAGSAVGESVLKNLLARNPKLAI